MRQKAQVRWAIVGFSGYINHGYMCFTRRAVIEKVVLEHRGYSTWAKFAGLTDAQFWRKLKRRRGYSVRRVALRLAR